jgi:hypothetical protein
MKSGVVEEYPRTTDLRKNGIEDFAAAHTRPSCGRVAIYTLLTQLDLPSDLDAIGDAKRASTSVVEACATGTPSPREAAKVMSVVSSHLTNVANLGLNEQLSELERKTRSGSTSEW